VQLYRSDEKTNKKSVTQWLENIKEQELSSYKDSALKNYLNRRSNISYAKNKIQKGGGVEIHITDSSDDAPKNFLGNSYV
jgi:hypothetical protein